MLTYDDVELDESSTIVQMRRIQDAMLPRASRRRRRSPSCRATGSRRCGRLDGSDGASARPAAVPARPPRAALVMLAAGEGRRTGHHTNKVLLPLAGRRVFTWSIRWAAAAARGERTLLVIREQDRDLVTRTLDREVGPTRGRAWSSAATAGTARSGRRCRRWRPRSRPARSTSWSIHDAARPLAGTQHVRRRHRRRPPSTAGRSRCDDQGNLAALRRRRPRPRPGGGGADPAGVPRCGRCSTAYRRAAADGFIGTDTASCIERYTDVPVRCVAGRRRATSRSPSPTTCSSPSGCWPRPTGTSPAAASGTAAAPISATSSPRPGGDDRRRATPICAARAAARSPSTSCGTPVGCWSRRGAPTAGTTSASPSARLLPAYVARPGAADGQQARTDAAPGGTRPARLRPPAPRRGRSASPGSSGGSSGELFR